MDKQRYDQLLAELQESDARGKELDKRIAALDRNDKWLLPAVVVVCLFGLFVIWLL